MKLTEEIKKLCKFKVGETVYIKQDVMNNQNFININGKEIDQILLNYAAIITEIRICIEDEESYTIQYFLRADQIRTIVNQNGHNVFLICKEFELSNEAEAAAIVALKKRNDK